MSSLLKLEARHRQNNFEIIYQENPRKNYELLLRKLGWHDVAIKIELLKTKGSLLKDQNGYRPGTAQVNT